ncbi:MAG: hypothetical protein OXI54_12605 [Chloroflexota bacterium]|nr:hypothetical protein [Chloroflexota bacterium]MDE2684972.1 hypothetical protein [Chloroflexota bacterium]
MKDANQHGFPRRYIDTLESAFDQLRQRETDDPLYDIFRAAAVKEFELVLEQSGNLLKRRLRPFSPATGGRTG